jgi:hypothetical protein
MRISGEIIRFVDEYCHERADIAEANYRVDGTLRIYQDNDDHFGRGFFAAAKIVYGLAPWYIPKHQAMLDHVHSFVAD